jgi:asparagine synthase (glutamine-hydrolysing)
MKTELMSAITNIYGLKCVCGLAGFWESKNIFSQDALNTIVWQMADTLKERGPDSGGVWCDEKSGIALGHRRLSIQDLSPAGHQPMVSASGRFVVAYNGEIYNAPELGQILRDQGVHLRGHCDTEVLLEAWEKWGPLESCRRFVGMFAFALWDRYDQVLYLVRDRVGVKPLYWGNQGATLFFGSTLKSLMEHPAWRGQINPQAADYFTRFGYVPTPHSIIENLFKVEPATIVTCKSPQDVTYQNFWDVPSPEPMHTASEQALVDELHAMLLEAVRCRLISDVPVGSFLSGGIDSTIVTALMQELSPHPVKTFTIGFSDKACDEAHYAAQVARHLGTDHTVHYMTDADVLECVPQIPHWYDEPFADSSQLPTYLVSRLAKSKVSVVLSGDGGDEVFSGYTRYLILHKWWSLISKFPHQLRAMGGTLLEQVPSTLWQMCGLSGEKIRKMILFGKSACASEAYRVLLTSWESEKSLLHHDVPFQWPFKEYAYQDAILSVQHADLTGYLMDDVLVKVDRASMAVGLEAREPLLDHRLIEWAAKVPLSMRIHQGKTKWLLRKILGRYIPSSLIDRPKQGFGIPLVSLLKGPLRSWTHDLLSERTIREQGLFDPVRIQHSLDQFDRYGSAPTLIWHLAMFQAWYRYYRLKLTR